MKLKQNKTVSRRGFLKLGGAVAGIGAMTTLGKTGTGWAQSVSGFDDYKALVCVFMSGGNDAVNTVIPNTDQTYADYQATRRFLSIERNSLLPFGDQNHGFNPNLSELHQLYERGDMALLANVGMLVQPITRDEIRNGATLPDQLFSHSSQSAQWNRGYAHRSLETGWCGRMADIMNRQHHSQLAMNLSLSGHNLMQTGSEVHPNQLSRRGATQLFIDERTGSTADNLRDAHQALSELNTREGNIFERGLGKLQNRARQVNTLIDDGLERSGSVDTEFPNTALATRLQTVARMIAARSEFGLSSGRQVFFVNHGGYDTHDNQLRSHPVLLRELSQALSAFHQATVDLGVANEVTTFTNSEFGRRMSVNTDGTDHGWGGHQFIIGGAVRGGETYGALPQILLGGPDDNGHGHLIPTTSVDQYAATLANWFGLSPSQQNRVFPHLMNFSQTNLGFMG